MVTVKDKTDLKKTVAKLAIAYYHWRDEGYPTDHEYHMWVALFDSQVTDLGTQ